MRALFLVALISFFSHTMLSGAQPSADAETVFLPAESESKDFPLHQAIKKNILKQVNQVIKANPESLYTIDKDGNTPIHYAAVSENIHLIVSLLSAYMQNPAKTEAGYKIIKEPNLEGKTALDLAKESGAKIIASRIEWATFALEANSQSDFDEVIQQPDTNKIIQESDFSKLIPWWLKFFS